MVIIAAAGHVDVAGDKIERCGRILDVSAARRAAPDVRGHAVVALGVTGGIAAYKAAELCRLLMRGGCEVRVVMTENACRFVTPLT